MSKRLNVQTSKCSNVQMSKCQSVQIPHNPKFKMYTKFEQVLMIPLLWEGFNYSIGKTLPSPLIRFSMYGLPL